MKKHGAGETQHRKTMGIKHGGKIRGRRDRFDGGFGGLG